MSLSLSLTNNMGLTRGSSFDPETLFAASEAGAWYDVSDLSTMFQDSAGTTAAVVGQLVGKLNDKSGNGNHATQTATASKPVLRQDANGKYYLEFDGVDDFLVTSAITAGSDKTQVFAGVRKSSDAAVAILAEYSANVNDNVGAWYFAAPESTVSKDYRFRSRGSLSPSSVSGGTFAAPITNVLTGLGDISGDSSILRVNGTQVAQSASDQGTGNYDNYPLYIGRRGGATLPFNGRIYGFVARFGSSLLPAQIAQAEAWIANKAGVTL